MFMIEHCVFCHLLKAMWLCCIRVTGMDAWKDKRLAQASWLRLVSPLDSLLCLSYATTIGSIDVSMCWRCSRRGHDQGVLRIAKLCEAGGLCEIAKARQ